MKKTHDYDSTFQTIKNKHKRLLIAVINDCFHKHYPMNTEVELLPTRSQLIAQGGKTKAKIIDRESDAILRIENDYYLIEVQAYDDENMAIRIAEYTFLAARDTTQGDQSRVVLNIPHFTVIYIKPSKDTPKVTEITYAFPNGQKVVCQENNVLLSELTKEEIIEKKLYAYIPFYVARYEKELTSEKDYQKAIEDLAFFREKMIELRQREELSGSEFTDLGEFVNNIVTHITNGNAIEKEVTGIMGGQVYETATERIQREVREELEPIIAEKDRELSASKDALAEKDRELSESKDALAEKEAALAKSMQRIAELEKQLALQ
jgi:hypothetical protein